MSATITSNIFGIDLGTTCSTIGRVEDGQPRLVPIAGSVLVPSIVQFRPDGTTVVGREAENGIALEPERTVRSAKRSMGTSHVFTIDGRAVTPEDVAAEVLRYLADGAEAATGTRPKQVVITVPAWFNQPARAATQRAAEAAGLEVVRLVNEPTAAALAHAHGTDVHRRALVYDFGGGTFDVSLVDQAGELVEVRGSHGDTRLGGDDIDAAIARVVRNRVQSSAPEVAKLLETSRAAFERLLLAARDAKHELSESLSTTLRVPFLGDVDGRAVHLEERLERAELETILAPLVERTLESVDTVLRDARIAADEVDELLLVGGSTRIPAVWDALHRHYGWEGSAKISPDLAVGLGAAVQGAIIEGIGVSAMLVDVAPHALAVVSMDATHTRMVAHVITPRNVPLPARHTKEFSTISKHQKQIDIYVVQGSNPNPLRNVILGLAAMEDLPPAPSGRQGRPVAIEFRHNLDGLVTVGVTDVLSGRRVETQITASGREERELREKFVLSLEDDDLIPGDGTDPDPFLEHEVQGAGQVAVDAGDALEPFVLTPTARPDVSSAKSAFERVLERSDTLLREHAACAAELTALAHSGLAAVKAGDEEAALGSYDQLSDALFENGVYL